MNMFVFGVTVFILVYILIATERMHKTIAALLGACVMLVSHVLSQEEGFGAIDFNVILLLVGMMVIVHILSQTGMFQWIAIKVAQLSKGEPIWMILMLCVITAVISAFLDNVTTVILIAPVVFLLADELEIDPVPFLILTVMASNIGGTATLVGDPPNILIGSAAGLSFNDFIINLAPIVVVNMIVFVITLKFLFGNKFHVSTELKARVMEMRADKAIKDKKLLIKCLSVLFVVLALFLLHGIFELEVATIAMLGAVVLMLITKQEPEEVFKHMEWSTLFFFIGLFIMVEGLVRIGFITVVAEHALKLTHGNKDITTLSLLWFSGIFSAIIDNIPYVATMIPLIKQMGLSISKTLGVAPGVVLNPLWWSLALGSCLGGNGTIVGASANVVVINLARKNGYKISFFRFLKYGALFLLESMIICTIYLYLRYLI